MKKSLYKGLERGSLSLNKRLEGETIEEKIERIVNNNEPITDGAPIIYTERKDGVLPGYDIRTDRFDVAIEGMDYVSRSNTAKREARIANLNPKGDGGAEPTEGNAN